MMWTRTAHVRAQQEPKSIAPGRCTIMAKDYWADRSYGAHDLEQHQWWFSQRVRDPNKK
jgi:hypothetical protein